MYVRNGGVADGTIVGPFVGPFVGKSLGVFVGFLVGFRLGVEDGGCVGGRLGLALGFFVGTPLGCKDGLDVGALVGLGAVRAHVAVRSMFADSSIGLVGEIDEIPNAACVSPLLHTQAASCQYTCTFVTSIAVIA